MRRLIAATVLAGGVIAAAPAAMPDVALPDGRLLHFDTVAEDLGGGAVATYGRSADGSRLRRFDSPAWHAGEVFAPGGRFRLDAGGLWQPVLPSDMPRFVETSMAPPALRAPVAMPRVATPDGDGLFTVDLLLLYTGAFAGAFDASATAIAAIQDQVSQAQAAFRTSGLPIRYRIAGIEPLPGSQAYSTPAFGQVAYVKQRRDAVHADLVALFENGACSGQATPFDGSTPTADDAAPSDVDAEHDAFAIVLATPDCIASGGFLLAHELGHTLGGGHDIEFSGLQAVPNPLLGSGYWKEYAHGVRCGNAGAGGAFKFASIMAYGLPSSVTPTDVKGDFFSSPDFVLDGEACGSEGTPGLEPTRADNVRSIGMAVPYVAAYRDAGDGKDAGLAQGSGVFAPWVLAVLGLLRALSVRARAARRPAPCSPSASPPSSGRRRRAPG
ncbi:MAG TPA: M12 family metallo-peptidase [Candidatus Binatia bacterium]|nr:M12 family metallo-peptidase [Candidatus Binatia bacterium]